MQARLLYTGQVVIDLVMGVEHLPVAGGDVLARSASFEVGGGFNVMAAACRNGLPVVYLGGHGQGRFGDQARQALAAEGIACASAVDHRQDTGLSVALIEPSAERSFISYVGAEGHLRAEDLSDVPVQAGDYVFVSGYSLAHPHKVEVLAAWVEGLPVGVQVAFDPGPLIQSLAEPAVARLLPRITLWTSNREEALRCTAVPSIESAMQCLAQRLPGEATLVLRDGPNGCWLHDTHGLRQVPGFPVQALDTNGAGDAHAGVLLAGMAQGLNTDQAAVRANAAAALAVTRWGPATAPHAAEVDAFLG